MAHLLEVSSIGGGRGKYREGSKASTYISLQMSSSKMQSRQDSIIKWSFPGSFLDRGRGRGKYREGSKASTYPLPSHQARCNHTRFDHHWSFPGSFIDRGAFEESTGKVQESKYLHMPAKSSSKMQSRRDSIINCSFLGSFLDRGRSKKVQRRFRKASAHPISLIRVNLGVHY